MEKRCMKGVLCSQCIIIIKNNKNMYCAHFLLFIVFSSIDDVYSVAFLCINICICMCVVYYSKLFHANCHALGIDNCIYRIYCIDKRPTYSPNKRTITHLCISEPKKCINNHAWCLPYINSMHNIICLLEFGIALTLPPLESFTISHSFIHFPFGGLNKLPPNDRNRKFIYEQYIYRFIAYIFYCKQYAVYIRSNGNHSVDAM